MATIERDSKTIGAKSEILLCPVCAASENRVWGHRTGHTMYECGRCQVVFFDRRKFENHDYQTYYEYTDSWGESRVAWELKIRQRALSRQLAVLGSYVEGRNLLDIGAGPGYLCRIAAANGWTAKGVEISDKARRVGEQFLNVQYIETEDVADGSIDVITCHHVLEHMERPKEFITELKSKLKPRGIIAVHVPHREPLSFLIRNKLSEFSGKQAEKLCQLYVPEHILGFTKDSLVNTFSQFGFETLMIKTSAMWSTYYDPFFLKNYLREKNYVGIAKHTLRSVIDNVGVCLGLGDWVVAHFRRD